MPLWFLNYPKKLDRNTVINYPAIIPGTRLISYGLIIKVEGTLANQEGFDSASIFHAI